MSNETEIQESHDECLAQLEHYNAMLQEILQVDGSGDLGELLDDFHNETSPSPKKENDHVC